MHPHISGYRITDTLYQSTKSVVYLAVRDCDGLQVVIKMLNEKYPNHQQIARFLHEFDIHKKVANIQGVADVYCLELCAHQQALVLEYISGGELSLQLKASNDFIGLFFKSAIQIATVLGEIHQHRIIHKDIKPKNILWQPDSETIRIIDFSIASELSSEKQNSQLLTGSLPYLSPEQTGRMNRAIDYRSDFYSLGVTFYQLLSGELPFDVNEGDPMAWVHCHIAREPKPLIIKEAAIAPALSAIITKLMAKNAEDRYQSVQGLKHDLEVCYAKWQATGTVTDFVAGQLDISECFDIPQKLYGRKQEMVLLTEDFAEISTGKCRLFLVNGASGIGKSALINEIHKPIVASNGYFISGKFDQFQRNIPYSALAQAFRSLMKQLLTEPTERLQVWRNDLLNALGTSGQVLIDFIPELENIIGKQDPVPHLGTEENQNRFNYLALRFLQLFARKKHLLVLFIDDLQWMDSASLHLIKLFMCSQELRYFLLLGAYRDNEVDAYHPLTLMIDELKEAGVSVSDLTLKPLQLDHINQLISESVFCQDKAKTLALAQTILHKTAGNPFFINQFLKNSVETDLLTFDGQQKSWQWDTEAIARQPSCDNVVDLMVAKMARLPKVTQNLLRLSACIGSAFDLHTLAIISEKNVQQVAHELWPAVTAGLLMTVGDDHALLKSLSEQRNIAEKDFPNAVDRFLHDRVQQAAYSLIEDSQKQQVHLKIARLLLQSTAEHDLETACFDILEHYNNSIDLVTDDSECHRLAALNLMAGQKAKESTAYDPALRYFTNATLCLEKATQYAPRALMFAVGKGQIECYFLLGQVETALKQVDTLLTRCQLGCTTDAPMTECLCIDNKIALNNVLILYYGGAGQMDKAIDIALDSLRLLAMDLPRNPNEMQLMLELGRAKIALGRKTTDELSALPLISDDNIHAIFSLLKELIAPTYLQGLTNLLPYIILRMFTLTLKHGNGPVASFAYSGYALLWSKLGNFAEAYRFGVLAMDYNKHVNNPPMEARCYFMTTSFALYWQQPLQNSQTPRKVGLQKLIDTGEYFWASYMYLFGFWQEVVLSKSLNDLLKLTKREIQFAQKAKQIEPYYVHTLHHNLFKNLAGQTGYSESLDDRQSEEAQALAYFEQNTTSTMGKFYHVVCRLVLHYYHEQYEQALAVATQPYITEEVICDGTYTRVIYTFYTCLSILALTNSSLKPADVHADYAKRKKKIEQWYKLCPENFAVLWYLLIAEEAAHFNKHNNHALDYYELALQAAKDSESLWFESLVNELMAKFWLRKNHQKIAAVLMNEAHYLYYRWGALGKVAELEKKYPHLLKEQINRDINLSGFKTLVSLSESGYTTTNNHESTLDIHTLFKASQALSGEIVMDKLLEKLMHFLIENAGAQRGVLLLKVHDDYVIEAECTIEQDHEIMNQPSVLLTDDYALSVMIVRYVARTKEWVLLDNVTCDSRFIADNYLQQARIKSVLCLPLLNKDEVSGVLYLENNIANNAFTPHRVKTLQILSAEIAISLENAKLYRELAQYNDTLEDLVKERTADLHAVNESLHERNAEIQQATKIIQAKSDDITKSILYAEKIQAAILPQPEKIIEILPDYFILFKPKEIVSGDFYWCNQVNKKLFLIVGDCTGHGVPGAFLSMIAQMLLNKIILEKRIFDPALILTVLHEEVKTALKQQGKTRQANDGMDIAICQIDLNAQLILYAGARRPLYLVRASDNELHKIAGDRKSIGGRQKKDSHRFTDHAVTFDYGDMLYLNSDGFADQHDAHNQKFSSSRLETSLQAIAHKDINAQHQWLLQTLAQHQGDENQRDDILLVGARLNKSSSHSPDNDKEKNVELFDLLSFRHQLIENDVILSFEGKMSQGVLISLVETLKEKLTANLNNNDTSQQMIRKIYGVFVELAQNIQNHSLEKIVVDEQKIGVGIIIIRENEQKFVISSGNKLSNAAAEKLRTYCDLINTLDEESLKKLYKEKLRKARTQETVGAGIGLIDIVRKSSHRIVYAIQTIDEQTQFFTLSVNLLKTTA